VIGESKVLSDCVDRLFAHGALVLSLQAVFNAALAECVGARNRQVRVREQLKADRTLKVLRRLSLEIGDWFDACHCLLFLG